jgi:hypothetical protein
MLIITSGLKMARKYANASNAPKIAPEVVRKGVDDESAYLGSDRSSDRSGNSRNRAPYLRGKTKAWFNFTTA